MENLPLTIIDRHEVPDGGSVIQVQLSNLNLNNPFIFNELGVFATHSDNPSEEFLYIIAQVDEGTGDRIPLYSATPVTATYDIYLYNVGADNVQITVSSSGLVTYEALNEACGMVKRSTSYAEEDIRYSSSLPIPYYLKCKVAGTTSSSSFVIPSDIEEGDTITDGTVVWEVLRLTSNDELQTAVNALSDGIVSTNTALAESTGYGIVSGCEPSINGLTVTVSAGVIHTADGRRIEVPEQSITLDAADATKPRTDVVYLDKYGKIAKLTGEIGTSTAPGLMEAVIKVGEIAIKAGAVAGAITASYNHYKTATITYHNVSMMRQDRTLMPGMVAHTLGYYEPNDGGGAVYIIRSKKESDVNDGGSILVLDNGNVAELIVDGSINVKQFGAVGDGVTDDSEAIQNAINATPKTGGILYFPPGKYIQGDGTGLDYQPDDTTYSEPTNRDIRYIFDSYDNLTISGYGAVIEANINNPSTQKHAGLVFTNCTNILIQGLTYDGRLDKRPKTRLSDGASWNKQHGIDIRCYNENITLMDVTCTRCMMDGFL